jgi:hypothetical protein
MHRDGGLIDHLNCLTVDYAMEFWLINVPWFLAFACRISVGFPPGTGGAGRKLWSVDPPHDGLPLAVVGFLRGDEVDARVAVLGVMPVEVPDKVGHGLAVIQEPPRVFQSVLGGAEDRPESGRCPSNASAVSLICLYQFVGFVPELPGLCGFSPESRLRRPAIGIAAA